MKNRHLLFLLSLFIFIFSCSPKLKNQVSVSPQIVAPFEFIVLQMNDVYEIAPLEGGKAGGLARVATIRKELLQENPNTITVLSGDFLSPSFIGTLKIEAENGEMETIAGLHMIETLNAMGLDYVTFGNHEFDIKDPDLLEKRMGQCNFKYTICNVQNIASGQPRPFKQKINGVETDVPEYLIHEMRDSHGRTIKLGLLGVLLPFNLADYVQYDPVVESFRKAYQELQPLTDLTLGITHLDIEQDLTLALDVPGIPLFIGGHDHSNMSRYVNNTIISKADANAKTVYIHRIRFDPVSGMTDIRSNIKTIDDTIEDDPETKMVVDKWLNKGFVVMKEMGFEPEKPILKLTAPLNCIESTIRNQQTNYGKLTMDALAYTLPDAEVYFINSGSMRLDDQLHNLVTEYDVLRTYPFGGKIVRMQLPGTALAATLKAGMMTNKGAGGYFQIKNAYVEEGNIFVNEKKIDPEKTYHIVLPEFVAQGKEANLELLKNHPYTVEDYLLVGDKKVKNDLRTIVINYMEKIETL